MRRELVDNWIHTKKRSGDLLDLVRSEARAHFANDRLDGRRRQRLIGHVAFTPLWAEAVEPPCSGLPFLRAVLHLRERPLHALLLRSENAAEESGVRLYALLGPALPLLKDHEVDASELARLLLEHARRHARDQLVLDGLREQHALVEVAVIGDRKGLFGLALFHASRDDMSAVTRDRTWRP